MRIVLLGSGGWIPTSRRETCCAYLREGERVLLIDAGTGVQRLVEQAEFLEGVERLDIVLTHFHLDHVVGLAYLQALPLEATVWGPGAALHGATTEDSLARLFGPPTFQAAIGEFTLGVHELPAEGGVEVGPWSVFTRTQLRHPGHTLAMRVGDVTHCTDTAFDPGNVEFARGSRLLLHEAWHAASETEDPTHSAAGQAGGIARDAGVERLVLIHINPRQGSDDEVGAPARAEFAATSVGTDLEPLDLA